MPLNYEGHNVFILIFEYRFYFIFTSDILKINIFFNIILNLYFRGCSRVYEKNHHKLFCLKCNVLTEKNILIV